MKKLVVSLMVILVVLIAVRVALPFAGKAFINHKLDTTNSNYRGHIQTVHFQLLKGQVIMIELDAWQVQGHTRYRILHANSLEARWNWKRLFHKELVATVRVDKPVFNYERLTKIPPPPPKVNLQQALRKMSPFEISDFQIRDGSVHYRDLTTKPEMQLYASQVNIDVRNITNSLKLSDTMFGTIDLKALVMDSGDAHVTGKFNPDAQPPEFKMKVDLRNLDLSKLDPALMATKDIRIQKGSLDVFAEVASADNKVDGYVKPLVHDLKVSNFKKDIKKGLGHALKEQALNAAANVLKNQPKNQQGTEIPFHGTLKNPKEGIWPAIGSTLQNIFIAALKPDFNKSVSIAQAARQKK